MSRLRDFIIGYGKSLELFPDIGSIDDDWKMVGSYLRVAIEKFPEMNNEEREEYKKIRQEYRKHTRKGSKSKRAIRRK